jgi:hypothetical protein
MTTIARPVVKNKIWIVEDNGSKVASIMAIEQGGFTYMHDQVREIFPSIKMISKKYNIEFAKKLTKPPIPGHDCYGYPCVGKPHNQLWDVSRRLPVYSKAEKSRSFFCAGHYLIKYNNQWIKEYCPKNITLSRYEFLGPYKNTLEQTSALHATTIISS